MVFAVTFFTGVSVGVIMMMIPKEHKKAERKYWDELESHNWEGMQKYAVKNK